MKVAVTAQGEVLDSPVAPHFARAPYFVVIDLESSVWTVRDNADLRRTLHRAGSQAAGILMSMHVEAVITGSIGPSAFATLKSAGVRVLQATPGSITEAIESFKAGRLTEFARADVEKHGPQSTQA